MIKILHFKLKILAKLVLAKYRPKIIAITGSVGKTSTKEAIFCVLKHDFRVARNVKNYNNEIGVPLTILRIKNSPGKNIFKWLWVLWSTLLLLIIKDNKYPQILVLEMAADKKGDIHYLTSIAKPDIAVITAIGSSHLEKFGTIKNIIKEKSSILKRMSLKDWAIINGDDPNLKEVIKNTTVPVKTFGQNSTNDVQVTGISVSEKEGQLGTSFKLKLENSETPMFLNGALGWQHAQTAAAAAAVAQILGLNMVRISQRLVDYRPARGRMNLLPGVNNTWVIDDTYNASPQSSLAALEVLAQVPVTGRRIAVFGDMLELGSESESGHYTVGKKVAELQIDYLFVFGERSKMIEQGAKEGGMNVDHIYHFPFVVNSGNFVRELIKPGDIVLVKGSRGSKMEQMVYEIMARPWEADEVLVGKIKR